MAIFVRHRKKGTKYQVKVRGTDGRWITATFDRKDEARAHEAKLTSQKLSGQTVVNLARQMTIEEYFPKWLEDTQTKRVSAGWRMTQAQIFRDYIAPMIGKNKISSIKPFHILQVLNRVENLGRGVQVQLHTHNVLHKMFGDAIEIYELIQVNPVKKSFRPKTPHKESQYLEPQIAHKLLNHVRGKSFEVAVWLGVMGGLRVGEIQSLKWENVDLLRGVVHIRSTYARKEKVFRDYPKGKKWRAVKLPPDLWNLLKWQRSMTNSDFVVTSANGQFLQYHTYSDNLKRYCREVGIPEINTHALRHSASEIYMEAGASRDDLRILFGHASSKTTDQYVHDRGQRLERVANRIQIHKNILECSPEPENVPQKISPNNVINFNERRFK